MKLEVFQSVPESLSPLFAEVPSTLDSSYSVGTVVVLLAGKQSPGFLDVSCHNLLGQDSWHTMLGRGMPGLVNTEFQLTMLLPSV